MLLVIDIGNTNTVLGIYKNENLLKHWRIETNKNKTFDEYGILIRQLLSIENVSPYNIKGVMIASVVPGLIWTFEKMSESYLQKTPLVVGHGIKTGMPILTDNPKEVGADRIVNAIAAYERYQNGCIIVDFGTATTFDCVSRKGEYIGGAIAPGFHISAEALFQHTSKLPRIEIAHPKKAIGKNTVTSMQSGIFFGYLGLVDETVSRISIEMGFKPKVIGTGGIASLFEGHSKTIEEIDEFLTLRGLRILYDRNLDSLP